MKKIYGSWVSDNGEWFIEYEGDRKTGKLNWLRISTWADGVDKVLADLTDLTEFRKRFPMCIESLEQICREAIA